MAFIIISKQNLISNIELIKSTINTQIAAVLKDNAYGHGLSQIAPIVRECGITSVFVKNNAEANLIKNYFNHITMLYPTHFDNLFENIYASISSLESLSKLPPKSKIELKINCGMNRNGIEINELDSALNLIKKQRINLIGVFSHNGYGDCALDADFNKTQENFMRVKNEVKNFYIKNNMQMPRFHSLSSSGALKSNNIDDDLVRIGIALYGYLGCEHKIKNQLKPVCELWANKIASRFLKKGSKIGYDGAGIMNEDGIITSYDIGYGDGFFRIDENKNLFTKEGFKIMPKSSMDSTSILCNEPKVCIMGNAEIFARAFKTISYEILCRLSPSLERIVK